MTGSHAFKSRKWKGLVREGWEHVFSDIRQLADSGKVIVDKPDRVVRRIETSKGVVYFKRIRGAGRKRGWYFLKSLFRQPRSLAVWKISEEMLASDLGCALPLLAVSSCSIFSFRFEDILVSAEIPFPRVSDLLKDAQDDVVSTGILQKAGQGIRELHERGFVHGDCLPGNICMDTTGKLIFLDNDRTREKSCFFRRQRQLWNLVQFCSRAMKFLSDMHLLSAFWEGYYLHDLRPAVLLESEQQKILKKLHKRIARLKLEQGKESLPTPDWTATESQIHQ